MGSEWTFFLESFWAFVSQESALAQETLEILRRQPSIPQEPALSDVNITSGLPCRHEHRFRNSACMQEILRCSPDIPQILSGMPSENHESAKTAGKMVSEIFLQDLWIL